MIIANGITMLEIKAVIMGAPNVVHPTLLWGDNRLVLVDAGYPGQLSLIVAALTEAGHPLNSLTDVIVTHQDIDHIGSLPALLDQVSPRPVVWASEIEKPYIQGERLLIKVTPEKVELALASLPPAVTEDMRNAFRNTLLNPPRANVDRLIGFGHEIEPLHGLVVLDTPGHTPGHISLYHRTSKTLIAGDALVVQDGQLQLASAANNHDHEQARRSLRRLRDFDIAGIICYHGGYYQGDIQARIQALLDESSQQ